MTPVKTFFEGVNHGELKSERLSEQLNGRCQSRRDCLVQPCLVCGFAGLDSYGGCTSRVPAGADVPSLNQALPLVRSGAREWHSRAPAQQPSP